MNLILLGPPGSGKGTQAGILSARTGWNYLGTGNLLRRLVKEGNEKALLAKSYMEKGKLVPDEITIKMVLERISAADCTGGVIFDGFPRTLKQAEALDKALGEQGKAVDKVVYIKVSEPELLKRLSGRWICRQCQTPYHAVNSPPRVWGKCDRCGGELYQRPDDTVDTVKKRLEVYWAETAPLIDYYTRAGKLIEVNGEGAEGGIEKRIIDTLRREPIRPRSR